RPDDDPRQRGVRPPPHPQHRGAGRQRRLPRQRRRARARRLRPLPAAGAHRPAQRLHQRDDLGPRRTAARADPDGVPDRPRRHRRRPPHLRAGRRRGRHARPHAQHARPRAPAGVGVAARGGRRPPRPGDHRRRRTDGVRRGGTAAAVAVTPVSIQRRGEPSVRLHPADNVVVAALALPAGTTVDGVTLRRDVPRGHKVAVADIAEGEPVRKYNQIIGFATAPIAPGDHVHTHNVEFRTFKRDYAVGADVTETQYVPESERATFQGIVRADGKVATRNYLGILTSVNCSAHTAKMIADQFRRPGLLDDYPNVDGVVALTHGTGCGMADDGEGIRVLRRTLAGYAEHPNFAGFLMLGLGCEVNQIRGVSEGWRVDPSRPVATMTIQDQGGTVATVRAGVEALKAMLPQANDVKRQPVPVSELVLGLNCGGSDAYSGITANPALGAAV